MKHFVFLFCFFSSCFLGSVAPAFGGNENCIDPTAAKRIMAKFNIQVEGNPDLCDPENSYTYKVVQALLVGESLDLTGPVAEAPWNQNILPKNWLNYLQNLTSNILGGSRDADSPGFCSSGPWLAYIKSYVSDTMFLCKSLFDPRFNVYDILGAMMHEARHQEGYSHVNCSDGRENSCDTDINERGSYAVTVEAMIKFGITAKNIHPAQQIASRSTAVLYANNNFANSVFKTKDLVFLTDRQGQVFSFDGINLKKIESDLLIKGVIAPRAAVGEFVLYPADPNLEPQRVLSIDGLTLSALRPQGTYMEEYSKLDPAQRALLKDINYDSKISATLYGPTLEVKYNQGTKEISQKIEWTLGAATHLFSVKDFNASSPNRLYVLNDQGNMYRIELPESGGYQITQIPNPIPGFTRISSIGNKKYLLNTNGEVFIKTENGFVVSDLFKDMRFSDMSRSMQGSNELTWLRYVPKDQNPW